MSIALPVRDPLRQRIGVAVGFAGPASAVSSAGDTTFTPVGTAPGTILVGVGVGPDEIVAVGSVPGAGRTAGAEVGTPGGGVPTPDGCTDVGCAADGVPLDGLASAVSSAGDPTLMPVGTAVGTNGVGVAVGGTGARVGADGARVGMTTGTEVGTLNGGVPITGG